MDQDVDDAQDARVILVILGEDDPSKASALWLAHLQRVLQLPCDVSGVEDFHWEERYVLGGDDPAQYRRLCVTQPSHDDVFSLEAIEPDASGSEWAMSTEDLGARVRRTSDGKEFVLRLSELIAVDDDSPNTQPLDDYAVWFVNYR
jgi:hypothetical protein